MNYSHTLYESLKTLYEEKGLAGSFIDDNSYLKTAFVETELMWTQNLRQLTKIKCIIIGEAPFWGDKKNYVYNPDRCNTQFFTRNDLGKELGLLIKDKIQFIELCQQIGLVFIDTFPFSLNKKFTKLNFQKMNEYDYHNLFKMTVNHFFMDKITILLPRCTIETKIAFRYTRTKDYLGELIIEYLIESTILQPSNLPIISLSKQGGHINRSLLSNFLTL